MNKQQSYHHYISWMNGDLVVTASLKGVQRSIVDHLHHVLVKTRHRELFYNTQLHGFRVSKIKSEYTNIPLSHLTSHRPGRRALL